MKINDSKCTFGRKHPKSACVRTSLNFGWHTCTCVLQYVHSRGPNHTAPEGTPYRYFSRNSYSGSGRGAVGKARRKQSKGKLN